jgi:hypothetical protein
VSTDDVEMAGYYGVRLVASSDTYPDAYLDQYVFDIYIGNECETYATQFYPDGYPEPNSEYAFKSVGQMETWYFASMDMWNAVDEHPCGDVQFWVVVSQYGDMIYEGQADEQAPLGLYVSSYYDTANNGVLSGHIILGEYQETTANDVGVYHIDVYARSSIYLDDNHSLHVLSLSLDITEQTTCLAPTFEPEYDTTGAIADTTTTGQYYDFVVGESDTVYVYLPTYYAYDYSANTAVPEDCGLATLTYSYVQVH